MKQHIVSLLAALLVWMSQDFNTLKEAVAFMNTLPAESGCYVVALNSQRSGWFNGYYSVVYKK